MLWPFCPLDGMLEALQWRTDVLRAYSSEQRVRLTEVPRRTINHAYQFAPAAVAAAAALLRPHAPGPFDLPEWQETSRVSVTSGASTVMLDTTSAQYVAGGKVALWQDWQTNELLTIDSLNAGSITFTTPAAGTYLNARIMPTTPAYAPAGLEVAREVNPFNAASMEWQTFDGEDWAYADGVLPLHLGDPIFMAARRFGSSTISERLVRDVQVVDNDIARPFFDPVLSTAVQTLGAAWLTTTAAERWALRRLLYTVRGRQKAFWLPRYGESDLLRVRFDADRFELAHSAPRFTKLLAPCIEVPE